MKLKTGLFSILGVCALVGGATAGLMANKNAVDVHAAGSATFYFDYTAGSWWGDASAVTKLQDNNGNRYDAELAYEGSKVYKVTIDTASVGSVKFVRLDPNNLTGNPWNESSINTDFTRNYCNLYDNGSGSNSYSWEASKTNYVLDMSGSLLGSAHNAHIWSGGDNASTSYPGRKMNSTSSSRLYEITFKGTFSNIIFNNGEGQTADLATGSDGKVWALQSDWDGKWVSMEAATFIDENMRFSSIPTNNVNQGTDCKGFYSTVKAAYNALSSNEIREEVLRVGDVQARLSAWAEANGDELDTTTFTPLSAGYIANPLSTPETKSNAAIIAAISGSAAVLALGGFFLLRRKREN